MTTNAEKRIDRKALMHECLSLITLLLTRVVEVGAEVTQTKVGDYVAAESHFVCGLCFQCRNGLRHSQSRRPRRHLIAG